VSWLARLLRRSALGPGSGVGDALVHLAEAWLAQGVAETDGSNAGPDVSWLIHDGGGTPGSRPPWCAYFISSACRQIERAGMVIEYARTGRAVAHWQSAPPGRQLRPDQIWTADPRGLVMIRTRVSRAVTDAEAARGGAKRQGHVALVTAVDPVARTIDLIAGNSTGRGHSRVPGGGAVARERITAGDEAWDRLVGFVRVAAP